MDIQRKKWNERQKLLNSALLGKTEPNLARDLFLSQQAMLYPSELYPDLNEYSLEDEVWFGLREDHARCVPKGCEHSIAWLMWHTTRCEDITMNLLVAGRYQVLHEYGWMEKLNIDFQDTGNSMDIDEFAAFNQNINILMLKAYRLAVGKRTRDIFLSLNPFEYKQKVKPERAARILAEKAVARDAYYLIEYWGSRTIAGLLLMPATRHHLVHINEAMSVRKRIKP